MPKKVKSFALEEEIYEDVSSLFKENYVDVNISYCVNKYLKELQSYLRSIEKELKDTSGFDVPMSYIIEQVTREPIFPVLSATVHTGMSESPLHGKVMEFQRNYDTKIKRYPEKAIQFDVNAIDDNVPALKIIEYIAKAAVEEILTRGKVPDDRYTEIIRKIGGKGLQKKMREKIAPALNKIDPDIKDVVKAVARKPKNEGKKL